MLLPAACCVLQKNHLSGLQRKLLKVSFFNVQQLMDVRREVQPTISANSRRSAMASAVAALQAAQMGGDGRPKVGAVLVWVHARECCFVSCSSLQ